MLYFINILINVICNYIIIIVYCMYVLQIIHMSQLSDTALTYAGDKHDYGNCKATMRNIDPYCNRLSTDKFANTKNFLESDIND